MDENHIPTNEAEVDSLLSSIDGPSENVSTPAQETAPINETQTQADAPATSQEAAEKAAVEQKFKINWRGEARELGLDQLINYAQQAYDYSEKMRDYKLQRQLFDSQQSEWKKKTADLEARVNQYKEVEDYIKTDPSWWDYVRSNYQQKVSEQGGNLPPHVNEVIRGLTEKVENMSGYITTQQEREKLAQISQEDQTLDTSVGEYKTKFSQFDWKSLDGNGLDLEKRILNHAIDNGIGTFKASANDYLHEEFLKRAELKAKEDTGKEIKKVTKLGLGPVRDSKASGIKRSENVSSKSWDDLADEALSELGLA